MLNEKDIDRFNYLWHIVGKKLREEMYKPIYENINTLTMIDLSIIQTIERNPKIIFKDICEILEIPKSTLTSAINRLEKKKLVKRIISKEDKRKIYLELTKTGIKAQQEHILTESTIFSELLSNLKEKEAKTFIDLFDKAIKEEWCD